MIWWNVALAPEDDEPWFSLNKQSLFEERRSEYNNIIFEDEGELMKNSQKYPWWVKYLIEVFLKMSQNLDSSSGKCCINWDS